jgi:hypothetical protein
MSVGPLHQFFSDVGQSSGSGVKSGTLIHRVLTTYLHPIYGSVECYPCTRYVELVLFQQATFASVAQLLNLAHSTSDISNLARSTAYELSMTNIFGHKGSIRIAYRQCDVSKNRGFVSIDIKALSTHFASLDAVSLLSKTTMFCVLFGCSKK